MNSDRDLDQLFSQLSINNTKRAVTMKQSRTYDGVKVTTKIKVESTSSTSQKMPSRSAVTTNYEAYEKKSPKKSSNYDDIPRKADGTPDYRYKAAKDFPKKYDGTPDLRFACNKPKNIQYCEYYSDSD